jgi:hypothetical protein
MMILWNGVPHRAHRRPTHRGDDSMHQHGPSDLGGPLRGTPAWWQGTGPLPDSSSEGASAPTTPRKGKKRMTKTKRKISEAVRPELVERIRREIAEGTYDSPEKWEAALDRLLNRLERE